MQRFRLHLTILLAVFYLPGLEAHVFQEAPTPTAVQSEIAIISPLPGQVLQGSVAIIVNTDVFGFQSAELAFAYADNPTETWFLIQQNNQPVFEATSTHWDTSLISDGEYTLRLIVTFSNTSQEIYLVPNLRVRNYSAIETGTPTPLTPTAAPLPEDIPQPTTVLSSAETPIPPTLMPSASNPVQLSRQEVFISVGIGALAVFGLFILAVIYRALRSLINR